MADKTYSFVCKFYIEQLEHALDKFKSFNYVCRVLSNSNIEVRSEDEKGIIIIKTGMFVATGVAPLGFYSISVSDPDWTIDDLDYIVTVKECLTNVYKSIQDKIEILKNMYETQDYDNFIIVSSSVRSILIETCGIKLEMGREGNYKKRA